VMCVVLADACCVLFVLHFVLLCVCGVWIFAVAL